MGILSLLDPVFEANGGGAPQVGDLYWVPTGYVSEVPQLLGVQRSGPTQHNNVAFELIQISANHFRGGRALPIKNLNLQGNEELLVARAKRRPCVVVSTLCVDDAATISDAAQQRLAQKGVGRMLYLVAPAFTVANLADPHKTFGAEIVARIRALQYPHLFCLPDPADANRPKSIVRLDQMFPTYLGRGCGPHQCRLTKDALEVFLCAVRAAVTGDVPKLYVDLREMIATTGLPIAALHPR